MKNIKEKIKSKVKSKANAVKDKMKGSAKKCAAFAAALGAAATLAGCASANPASRANESSVKDVSPTIKVELNNSVSNTVSIVLKNTIGDGVLASADSSGSTETQTATPTLDIRTKVDARYNDALAAASTASKGVIESLTEAGANKVLSLMADKSTGTVEVQKKDGTTVTVECKDGQCAIKKNCESCTDTSAQSSSTTDTK